ncbi:hypothetical protein Lal_00019470 [Lupinus albus]|uniref:Putative pectinesterase inhibitor domain-containing protein n=1 Tax=Lupinus albus TaxID=3870 RepID=A0A6A5PNW0_LUPAL|nr:putative pectinesterase inhibitor domain-containing protein [Lupinus albus]KAF1899053.1 hypothetical protein Lal_00019174 [Lupinus albus]KAF1899342.1 hypothetical protein Lal_00019470 [Lupinus albus]
MARLACCLVLISLCLCIVFEPALALAQAPSQDFVLPPASAPFPIIVPSEYVMAKQLCQDTKQPELCHKIILGDKIDPVTEAKLTIQIASSMAFRASAYMSKISTRKDVASGALNSCLLSYKKAISALNLSYNNFQTNPNNAIQSLRKADYHVGFCTASLGPKDEIPPVLKANKAMQGMIQAIRSVAMRQLN